jgi:hypothetical protein
MKCETFRANMKTLLRKIPSGLYFQGPDQWTSNPSEGFNFKSIDRALQFIETWRLTDVELAFAFSRPNTVTRVPLDRMATRYSQK